MRYWTHSGKDDTEHDDSDSSPGQSGQKSLLGPMGWAVVGGTTLLAGQLAFKRAVENMTPSRPEPQPDAQSVDSPSVTVERTPADKQAVDGVAPAHSTDSEESDAATSEPTPVFQLDAITLFKAYESVCENPDVESLVYLTGPQVEGQHTVTHVFDEVEAESQSATNVDAHPEVDFQTLQALSEKGYTLQAYCHNHPGTGQTATRPSQLDLNSQKRLEGLNHEVIGLIMTRDGYVRAFSNDLDFELEVYGDNVERLNDTTFKLQV